MKLSGYNKDMKDGFTLIEVSILFIIFLVVAVLIVPLSVDDVMLAKNVEKWKQSQLNFSEIAVSMMGSENYKSGKMLSSQDFMAALVKSYPLKKVVNYKIKYLNGDIAEGDYSFSEIYMTNNGAGIGFHWLNNDSRAGSDVVLAKLMYDVNGKSGPNVWGRDIFGFDVYKDRLVPFGTDLDEISLEVDCSRQGTGVACSAQYLKGYKR